MKNLMVNEKKSEQTDAKFDCFRIWKTIENDYCQVHVIDQFKDCYSIQIKYDYLNMIRKRRAIAFVNNNSSN